MELRVLRYFLAVAQEENISAAANYLHLTQPTLSRQLMELEKELGKPLFIRGKRRITLTEDGLILRKRAGEIIGLVDKMTSEVTSSGDTISGDVYIGGGETDAMRMLARAAKDIRRTHPDVRFHIYSGNAEDVSERLDKGLLDFGVFIEPVDLRKYDHIRLPACDTWGLLMLKDHPLASRDMIRSEDLRDLPIITSRQTLTNEFFSSWLGDDFSSLNIVATYNLIFNASLMVSEGVGCALTLEKLVDTGESSPFCFRRLDPPARVGLDLVWKKYQVFSRAASAFLDTLRAQIGSPPIL